MSKEMDEMKQTLEQELWEFARWARFADNHVWECCEHNQPQMEAIKILSLETDTHKIAIIPKFDFPPVKDEAFCVNCPILAQFRR